MNKATERPTTFEEFIAWQRDLSPEEAERRRRDRNLELAEKIERENLTHRIEIARRLSNIGERFLERTLDAYECPPGDPYALSVAREVAKEPASRGVWFCGGKGTGKTQFAAGIINIATSRGIPATYVKTALLFEQFNECYDRNGRLRTNKLDVIGWLSRIEVLALDDIDKIEFTAKTSRLLYILIDQRYECSGSQRKRRMIITSNHEPAQVGIIWRKKGLDAVIGDTIIDRLCELCGQFVAVEGESYRQRLMGQAQ